MTTKFLNPRDTTKILRLAKRGIADTEYQSDSTANKCFGLFVQIAAIAKAIDARETRRDPSLRRRPVKKRS